MALKEGQQEEGEEYLDVPTGDNVPTGDEQNDDLWNNINILNQTNLLQSVYVFLTLICVGIAMRIMNNNCRLEACVEVSNELREDGTQTYDLGNSETQQRYCRIEVQHGSSQIASSRPSSPSVVASCNRQPSTVRVVDSCRSQANTVRVVDSCNRQPSTDSCGLHLSISSSTGNYGKQESTIEVASRCRNESSRPALGTTCRGETFILTDAAKKIISATDFTSGLNKTENIVAHEDDNDGDETLSLPDAKTIQQDSNNVSHQQMLEERTSQVDTATAVTSNLGRPPERGETPGPSTAIRSEPDKDDPDPPPINMSGGNPSEADSQQEGTDDNVSRESLTRVNIKQASVSTTEAAPRSGC